MLKKIIRVVLVAIGSVVLLFMLLAVALYIPSVQNFVVHKVAGYASEKTGMDLRVGRVRLAFPLDLALINTFASQKGDTVLDARSVRVNVALLPLFQSRVDVDGLEIYDSKINTVDFISNTQIKGYVGELKLQSHGIDLANSYVNIDGGNLANSNVTVLLCDTAKEDTTPKKPTVWRIKLSGFDITNSAVKLRFPGDSMRVSAAVGSLTVKNGYFDIARNLYTVEHIGIRKTGATYDIPYEAYVKKLDPNHIAVTGFNADIDSLKYNAGAIRARLKGLTVKEKSGLALNDMGGTLYVDSAKLELGGFKLKTPYSTLNATGVFAFDALNRDGEGAIKLKIGGNLDRRDLISAIPGGLGADVEKLLPVKPVNIDATLGGEKGNLTVENGKVSVDGMMQLRLDGKLNDITSDKRSGNLRYSLKTWNIDYLKNAFGLDSESGINIPHGVSAYGTLKFRGERYETDSRLVLGHGKASVNGWFDTHSNSYSARVSTQSVPLGKIVVGSGLHNLTSQISAAGSGFDPFGKSMKMSAKANFKKFGVGGYDLSNTKIAALMRGGAGKVSFVADNDILQGQGNIDAQFTKKSVKGKLNAKLGGLDIKKLTGGEKNMKLSTRAAATFYANSNMSVYGIDATVDSIMFHVDSGKSFRAKDLLVKLDNHRDSLYARVSAGDLHLTAHSRNNIDRISAQVGKFMTALNKQIKHKHLDQELLRKQLPAISLMVDAGNDNPLSNFLKFHGGYSFNQLFLHLQSDPHNGIDGTGYIHSLNTGSILLDTMNISLYQDTTGLRFKGLVHNATKHNPYIFTAGINGYLLNDGAGVEVVYKDKKGVEGMNVGMRALLTDSGTTFHMYPENPVIAYRKFKVNKDNYLTLFDDNTLQSDIDLLADDGTGLKVYGNRTDSVSDITVSVNQVNLRELTSSIPFAPLISGFLSGDLHVTKENEKLAAAYDLGVKNMEYEGAPLGDIGLVGTYFPMLKKEAHYINTSITRAGEEVANLDGTYYGKSDSLNACLQLEKFPTEMFNGFTGETLGLDGYLGGDLDLTGTTSKPMLNGKVLLDSVRVYSDIYGINLRVENDSAIVRNSVLHLDTLNFYSTQNNPLVVDGNLDFSNFDNVNMNMKVKAQNFKLINSKQTAKSEVYGTVYSDVDVTVQGTLSSLFVYGNLNVLPKTDVSYVLKDSPLSAENDLKSLVSFVDFSDTAAAPPKREEATGVTMVLNVNINDVVHLHCDINDDKQSYIDVEGGGNLTFKYTPTGEMFLTGRYTMNSGEMKYALPVIPLRTFYLTEGSYIDFTGEPMNPTLNIAAKERVKASVNDNDKLRSVNFDVGLKLTQPLNRMGLEFTIEAPDDQTIQNQLASMSAEQKNKLAISMLATGLYLEENNASNGLKTSNALNAFLQNQVQQIAGKALKSVDLSVSVEDGTSATGESNTDYSFRFAKKFWGNRVNVIIGGHVSTGEDARNDASSFIDNISLEYRIDNSAKRYVRIFYDHNSQDPLEGSLTEAGAGLVLRRKAEKFGEIFTFWKKGDSSSQKSQKKKRKKTEARAMVEKKREGSGKQNNNVNDK